MSSPQSTVDQQIFKAAGLGDLSMVLACIQGGASLSARHGAHGSTALHTAAAAGRLEVVQVLLGAGAPVDDKDSKGRTALLLAAEKGHQSVVRELLAQQAQPDTPDNDAITPLLAACYYDRIAALQCLLGNSQVLASINAIGSGGNTPLLLASSLGHAEVVSLLVEAGADIHAVAADGFLPVYTVYTTAGVRPRWTCGCTPLHAAVVRNHVPVVKVLLAAGADPLATTTFLASSLHLAAQFNCLAALQELLAAADWQANGGVDTLADGMTALHWAACRGHTGCVQALLAAGADANKACTEQSTFAGATALHLAVRSGNKAAVSLLMTPTNLAAVWDGRTPFHMALCEQQVEVALALMAAGESAGAVGQQWGTAMAVAARSRSSSIKALVPDLMRKYCGTTQQQQQQEGQAWDASGEATVASTVCVLVTCPSLCASCLNVVMEAWGLAAARTVLQEILTFYEDDHNMPDMLRSVMSGGDCTEQRAGRAAEPPRAPALVL